MRIFTTTIVVLISMSGAKAQWMIYENETANRLIADPSLGVSDNEEKDFALGDVDLDGDLDLVVVRKTPLSVSGPRANVLFLNEGTAEGHLIDGVFVDRTADYVVAATDGGQGFLDLTNDRDVVLVDVNGDDWLDIVTACAVSDGLPKTISHPRVYRNLGDDVNGDWQGFIYEEFRIPQLLTINTELAVAPRFAAVAAGDVTGDGFADLYFADHDNGATAPLMPPGHDLNDRLLVNDGTGVFEDSLESRMNSLMLLSAFGVAAAIEDMNGDGFLDVVKNTALQTPERVSISYNDPDNVGFFNDFDIVYSLQAYHISVGELNNDGRLDLVITDHATDRYLLNVGNDVANIAGFSTTSMPTPTGFGGNSWVADLDNDTFNDVIITDFHVDSAQAGQRTHVYRNLGNPPAVAFDEPFPNAPWSPEDTHDAVTLDLNDDGWLDIVYGTSTIAGQTGYQIWINQPPIGITYAYPDGLPDFISPATSTVTVEIEAFGGPEILEDSATLRVSINGGPFQSIAMTHLGANEYGVDFPDADCLDGFSYYFSAMLEGGGTFTDPSEAPFSTYATVFAGQSDQFLLDQIEADVSDWIVVNENVLTGSWEQADPNGTESSGQTAAPDDDATLDGSMAFVTENGEPDGAPGTADVDGGPTRLISPSLDLTDSAAYVEFAAWFFDSLEEDVLEVDVSANGGVNWVPVMDISSTSGNWKTFGFLVNNYVSSSSDVRVRFSVMDGQTPSIVEAGVDDFEVTSFTCQTCIGDGECSDGSACTSDACVDGICAYADETPAGQCCDPADGALTTIADGSACTDDFCNADGSVDHVLNFDPGLECCDPDQGTLVAIDDNNDCTADSCDAQTGVVSRSLGTPMADALGSRKLGVTPAVCSDALAMRVTPIDQPCPPVFVRADGTLGSDPVYLPAASWASVAIRGDEIVPEATYQIQSLTSGGVVSSADEAMTWRWADVDNNDVVNLGDAFAAVLIISGSPSPGTTASADLEPCAPNGVVNLADVLAVVMVIGGGQFGDQCPVPCVD